MLNTSLRDFIGINRGELILRCRAKVATRPHPLPSDAEIDHGVPLFLDQLVREMSGTGSNTYEIGAGAIEYGRYLFLRGFTISEVVHTYGDVCQSITDLAVELDAPISAEDFRTLNRCLDDAIASAVTEYAREQDIPREGELDQLKSLTNSAIAAFEILQTGRVGVAGSTGVLVHRNLVAIRAAVVSRLGPGVPAPPEVGVPVLRP